MLAECIYRSYEKNLTEVDKYKKDTRKEFYINTYL